VKAGVLAIMPAFTDLAGIPMTAHAALLKGLLREKLGFDGIIVSDYNAVGELIRHGVAADKADAAALALKAGVDIDMMADAYRQGLPIALKRGLVQLSDIDAAVRRVLSVKERLGLFENPYRHAPQDDARTLAARRALSRKTAAASMVLLKNQAALPFKGGYKRVALLGPLAIASAEMRGPWWGAADPAGHISVFEGLRALWPKTDVLYESGCGIEGDDTSGIKPALEAVDAAEVVILCLGEAAVMSGEAASRAHIELPGIQQQLAEAVCARAAAQKKKVVAVVFSGRPLAIAALTDMVDGLIAAWFPGSEAGNALADILSGSVSPSGKMAVSWPRTLGQVPIFYAERPGGRPMAPNDHYTSKYLDVSNDPMFAFGAGLTYGEFSYSNLRVSPAKASESDTLEVSAELRNVGGRTATETVFVFTRDPVASVSRPLLELRGFTRVTLEPGKQQRVTLKFPASELKFLGIDLKPTYEAGELEVLLGPSAERARLLSTKIEQV
jgi:beta-glucosidase